MKTTGTDIVNLALALMAENASSHHVEDYRQRALPLMNLLLSEIRAYEAFFEKGEGPMVLQDLAGEIFLDDRVTRYILPYGLAARLLLEEDPARAGSFHAAYEKGVKSLWRGKITPIKRVW